MVATLNLLKGVRKGGIKDGAQMKITKNDIKKAILESLEEQSPLDVKKIVLAQVLVKLLNKRVMLPRQQRRN